MTAVTAPDWLALPWIVVAYAFLWWQRRTIWTVYADWAVPDGALRLPNKMQAS